MADLNLITVKGTIHKVIYKNPDNDYFIAKLTCEDDKNLITIVGTSYEIQPGEKVVINGQWKENKKYGLQLEIETMEILLPASIEGIEKYLGSGLIKGIGPVTAKKIVEKFGLSSLNILDNEPEKLLEIEGLASKKLQIIKKGWKKQNFIREIMIFIQSYGISNNSAIKIYNKYESESINVLKTNPYRLIDDISGIGFKTADSIAEKLGIEKDSAYRIKSGILYLLNELTNSGHCYYPYEDFINMVVVLLQVGEKSILKALHSLCEEKKIYIDNSRNENIYLYSIFEDEQAVAQKLINIRDSKKREGSVYYESMYQQYSKSRDSRKGLSLFIDEKIEMIAGMNKIELDEIQTDAIKNAILENVFIITGSPGTGKSTILRIIIQFFKETNKTVMIAAPTGRAAKRLSEATGYEAKTIHRLLKYQPKLNRFLKNENNKLESDIIIIDEASMIDIRLFKSLLAAIDTNTTLIIVGDADQLPAVGPGNILSDIINSKAFKVVRLQNIYRQGGQSKIIYNAHRIRDGLFPSIKNSEFKDFYFIEKIEPESVVKTIIDLIIERIPENFNYHPVRDIQVIVPTNKGIVGSNNLNLKIQEHINKSNTSIARSNISFKLNDKIIQLKNNYEKEVFNGDIGYIKSIDFEMKEVKIDFDGRTVTYDFFDTDQINLSYAISIHKAQGSEFKCVIIPILTSHYMLLQRNLLYTAITRAKEVAVLIGSKKAVGIAVNKNIVENRYTGLKDLLSCP